MATRTDDLLIGATVDPRGITEGMDEALRLIRQAADQMEQVMGSVRLAPEQMLPPGFPDAAGRQGRQAGERLAQDFTQRLRDERGRFVAAGEEAGDAIVEGAEKELQKQRERIVKAIKGAGKGMEEVGKELSVALTAPIVGAGVAALHFSREFEDALAQVRKTTDLTEAQIVDMTAALRALSERPGRPGAPELANLAALGAQLGITQDQLVEFADVVAGVDLATNLSAEEAATELARFANVTQLPQDRIENLASTVIALGNTTATTEREIMQMATRLAASGSIIGLAESEIVGFAAALSSVGVEAEAGGTAFSKVFQGIATAVASGTPHLTEFARIAGMSVAEFRQAFTTDAAGAIREFVEGLAIVQRQGENVFATLEGLGMDEQRLSRALLSVSNAGDVLARSINTANVAFVENTALTKEVENFSQTSSAQMRALGNAAKNVSAEFGDALRPMLLDVIQLARVMIPPIRDAVAAFAALPQPVRTFAVGVAGVTAAAGPAMFMLGRLAQSVVALRMVALTASGAQGLGALVTTMRGMPAAGAAAAAGGASAAAGVRALATSLLAGGGVVVGVAAVAAIVYQLAQRLREGKREVDQFREAAEQMSQLSLSANINAAHDDLIALEQRRTALEQRLAELRGAPPDAGWRHRQTMIGAGEEELRGVNRQIEQTRAKLRISEDAFNRNAEAAANAKREAEEFTRQAKEAVEEAVRAARAAMAGTGGSIENLVSAASASVLRLNVATELGAGPEELAQLTRDVLEQERRISEEIERRGGVRQADTRLLEEQRRLLDALRLPTVVGPIRMPKMPEVPTVDLRHIQRLKDAVQEAAQAQQIYEQVRLTPNVDETAFREARDRMEETRAAAIAARTAAVEFLLGLGLDPATLATQLEQVRKIFGDLGEDVSELSEDTRKLLQQLRSMATAARGVLQVADAFDSVDQSVRRTIEGIAGLIDSVGEAHRILAESDKWSSVLDLFKSPEGIASVIGMVGGAVSLVSGLAGLFAQGPGAGEQLIAKNIDALESLEAELRGVRETFANLSRAEDATTAAMQAFARDPSIFLPGGRGDPRSTGAGRAEIEAFLAPFGVTFAQLQHHAEQLGLSLVDAKGRINLFAFEQFADAIDLAREAALQFGNSFSELQQYESVRADLFNLDGPVAAWEQAVRIAEEMLPPHVAQALAGFDVDTRAGRQAAQEYLQHLFGQLEDQTSALALLGDSGFETRSEFLSYLAYAVDPLKELGDAAAEVAGTMRNIPAGYKLDRQRWASIMAEIPNLAELNRAPEARVPTAEPVPPALTAGGRTDGGAGQTVIVQQENHWHIDRIDAQDRPLREVYRELKELAQQDAYNHFGDSSRVAEVLAYN